MTDFLNELAYAGSPYQGTANLSKMAPDFMSQFDQMSQEYYAQTGKEIKVNDAFRTREMQEEAYKNKPNLAAKPGHSNHEKGMAMDIDDTQANQLSEMGLFDKYGFTRPMMTKSPGKKYEPWHIELAGGDLEKRMGAVAATVKPDFMSELNAVGGFSQELGAIGQPPIGPSPPATQQVPPGEEQPQAITPTMTRGEMRGAPSQPPEGAQDTLAQFVNEPGVGKELARTVLPVARPVLELGGLAGGAAVGAAGGIPTGGIASPAGAVLGGGLGYAGGKKAADALEAYAGQKPVPAMGESLIESGKDVATGAMMEMGGQVGGKVLQKGLEGAGKVIKPILGRISGVGAGGPEAAIESGKQIAGWNILNPKTAFNKALRGEITGEEVVDIAKSSLQEIKDVRSKAYTTQLAEIGKNTAEIDVTPINLKLRDLMKQYRIKITPEGDLDFSSVAIGNKGRKDIKEMVETVWEWKDKTPLGLDALKRYLGDFYSESSQARAFTTALTGKVKDTLAKAIPEYAEMTKGYAEATTLIKDLEAGLMLRKQGMTGRIVSDQTLRRITSALKEGHPLRNDLVKILGETTGKDLEGMVAGYAMSQVLPRGLAGAPLTMIGEAALAHYVNPKFWAILVASSPRVQGEFLQMYGKVLKETAGASLPVAKITAYLAMRKTTTTGEPLEKPDQNRTND